MPEPDRLPPFNQNAEMCVLGSMLRDNGVIPEILSVLKSGAFYFDAHQRIFKVIEELHTLGKPVDLIVLDEMLRLRGWLEDVGGPPFIASLWECAPTAANAEYYGEIVRDKAISRQLIQACTTVLKDTYDQVASGDQLLVQAQQEIMKIAVGRKTSEVKTLKEVSVETMAIIDARCTSKHPSGVLSGLYEVDSLTSGFQPQELIILAARPSQGKTAFAINIAENASKSGVTTLVFSIEQRNTELYQRMLCGNSGVGSQRVREGKLSGDDVSKLIAADAAIRGLPILISDDCSIKAREIATVSRREMFRHKIGMIIIDYLQLVDPDDLRSPRHEQVASMSRSFKRLARELNIPVVCLAQLNRNVDNRGKGATPLLSDLKESGAIEQDADTVIFLHRVRQEPDPHEPVEPTKLIVAKQRNGPTGVRAIMYRKATLRFENSAAGEYDL